MGKSQMTWYEDERAKQIEVKEEELYKKYIQEI